MSASDILAVQQAEAILQWYLENGVDEVMSSSPVDRLALKPVTIKETEADHKIAVVPQAMKAPAVAPETQAESKAEAIRLASEAQTLEDLKAAIQKFEGLSLKKTAMNMVFAAGNPLSSVMVFRASTLLWPHLFPDARSDGRLGEHRHTLAQAVRLKRRGAVAAMGGIWREGPAGRRCRRRTVCGPRAAGQRQFGRTVVTLPNGNIVVTDPLYDVAGVPPVVDAGAVYLYRPDGTLISTLHGSSANDRVGRDSVVVLANGNYVICSADWDNGSVVDAGAVTFASGTTGVSGPVSEEHGLPFSVGFDPCSNRRGQPPAQVREIVDPRD